MKVLQVFKELSYSSKWYESKLSLELKLFIQQLVWQIYNYFMNQLTF